MKKLKGVGGKLDTAWAHLVKLKAGMKCEYCGSVKTLQSHHIYSRSKYSTRWDTDNGICLCASHHVLNSGFSAHKTPIEFVEWLQDYRGLEFIDSLRLKAHTMYKFTNFEKEELLEELQAQIKKFDR